MNDLNHEATDGRQRANARFYALRALSARRLTETKLRERLVNRGYAPDEINAAVEFCKRHGFIDDRLYAQLYVDGKRKAVGDARLVAELVRRGVDREAARTSVAAAEEDQDARLQTAIDTIYRKRPSLAYPNAARALERLGFPAPAIYRHLRARAAAEFPMLTEDERTA